MWNERPSQQVLLDWLDDKPYTTLFITGNHENYDLLEKYPVSRWHGGNVQFIRENVIHLQRGQIFDIGGHSFFTMGGAACHDIGNGVLDMDSPDYQERVSAMGDRFFRINHVSWWEQELPSREELEQAGERLRENGMKVDYVISHCAPTQIQRMIQYRLRNDSYEKNRLTNFLQWVYDDAKFSHWYCGHYHIAVNMGENFHLLYRQIINIHE